MTTKAFDAVKFMRDTRDELSKKYLKNPETQQRDLTRIRKKYGKFKHTVGNKRPKDAPFL